MKKVLLFIAMFMVMLMAVIAYGGVVYASDLTTTESTTQEETTTTTQPETTTNPVVTTSNPVVDIEEDGIYVNGVKLNEEQLADLMTYYIDLYFGDSLAKIGWSAAGVVTVIIFLGSFLLFRIKKNTLAVNNNSTSQNEVKDLRVEVQQNKQAAIRAESRALKAEAMTSLVLQGLTSIMANSTNENNAKAAVSFKAEVERLLAAADNENELKQIVTSAVKEVGETIIGQGVNAIKVKRAKLVAKLQSEPEPAGE